MKTAALAILTFWTAMASAQVASTPAPPGSPAPAAEVEKWLAQVDGSQQEEFQKRVVKPFEAGVAGLRTRYLQTLDAAIDKASSANQLDEALRWRTERQAFEKAQNVGADAADTPAEIKALRAGFRQQLAKLDQDRIAQARALLSQYDATLEKYQSLLTEHRRLDDALLLKTKREEVARTWLAPSSFITVDAPATGSPAIAAIPAVAATPTVRATPAGAATPVKAEPIDDGVVRHEHNLFVNSHFESGTLHWELVAFGKGIGMAMDSKELHDGKRTLRVDNSVAGHAFVKQVVKVKPNMRYRLTGFIKTKNVESTKAGEPRGAVLMVGRMGVFTPTVEKTTDWTKVSIDFTTTDIREIGVGPSLGTDGIMASGTAWFSDLALVELSGDEKK